MAANLATVIHLKESNQCINKSFDLPLKFIYLGGSLTSLATSADTTKRWHNRSSANYAYRRFLAIQILHTHTRADAFVNFKSPFAKSLLFILSEKFDENVKTVAAWTFSRFINASSFVETKSKIIEKLDIQRNRMSRFLFNLVRKKLNDWNSELFNNRRALCYFNKLLPQECHNSSRPDIKNQLQRMK